MKKEKSEEMLNVWAMVFGNKDVRELGKEKSEWFKKIYDALDNDVPGFLEFIFTAELTYGKIIAKEELIPTTSLIVIKMRKKEKSRREKAIADFFNGNEFDDFCKETYYIIEESAKNGNR